MKPFVSVIFPVLNDLRINLVLDALINQTYPSANYGIIVADNGSEPEIFEIIERYCKQHPERVYLIRELERQSSYAARNKAIGVAKGEVIAFTDSDCIPASDWIEQGVTLLSSIPNCGLVGGRIEITYQQSNSPTIIEVYERVLAFQQEAYVKKLHYAATANLFTFKHVIDHVGVFEDRLQSGGDVHWGQRVYQAGYKQLYGSSVIVTHPARRTWDELRSKTNRVIIGRYDLDNLKIANNYFFYILFKFRSFSGDILPFLGWIRKIYLYKGLDGLLKLKLVGIAICMYCYRQWVKIKLLLGLNEKID